MKPPENVELGAIVGVHFGSHVRRAEVVEDLGNLGPDREHAVRVLLDAPPGEEVAMPMAVSWLVAWPPPAELDLTQPARWRAARRRAARRNPTPA